MVGLGYVGLPLAQLFLESGHTVYGIDTDRDKIKKLLKNESDLVDVSADDVAIMFASGRFQVSSDYSLIENVDVVIFCLPTPLDRFDHPDLSIVEAAFKETLPYIHSGQLLVLESTTYPGTTEEKLGQLLEASGLKVGQDVALAYSPERIDPGQKALSLKDIPKVVSGVTPSCTNYAKTVYETAFKEVVIVSKPRAAEMTKLLENCQRYVNISLMNELAILCNKLDIDLWEVIEAAATKPYGFVPYTPGPGIGGHCIPIDPLYLRWRAKQVGSDLQLLEASRQINAHMPQFVVTKVLKAVSKMKPPDKSRILIVGVTYKKDVSDLRESAALKVMEGLLNEKVSLTYHDPFVDQLDIGNTRIQSVPLTEEQLQKHDCTVILTDHSTLDYSKIVQFAPLVVDTRNATGSLSSQDHVILL